jgi:hypothetical protein
MPSLRLLPAAVAAVALVACQEAPPPRAPVATAKAPVVASAAPAPAAPGRLKRPEVDQVLVQNGPPWVLRRILSEEVMSRDGKFTGWRLVGLPEEWRGLDLRPGDVVTRVNGLALETPDQAWEAWKSIAKVPEIRITLTRDGASREVVLPIEGAPSPDTLKLLGRDGPAPRASAPPPPSQRGSVQLGGAAPEPASDDESF